MPFIIVLFIISLIICMCFYINSTRQKPLEKGSVDQTTTEPGTFFCKDCNHCIVIKHGFGIINYKCGKCKKNINPQGDDYLVTGVLPEIDPDAYYYYCSTARSSEYMCGKDAALFDPKETDK